MTSTPTSAKEIIEALGLEHLDQEGGWFRQTLARGPEIDARLFGPDFPAGARPQMTAILAMIGGAQFSAMHRLGVDELWLFHMGAPLEMLMLHLDGSHETVILGHDVARGQRLQHVVPAGTWQGSTALGGNDRFSLVSCIMVPGFVWEDFELGNARALAANYPDAEEHIASLTRDVPAKGVK